MTNVTEFITLVEILLIVLSPRLVAWQQSDDGMVNSKIQVDMHKTIRS